MRAAFAAGIVCLLFAAPAQAQLPPLPGGGGGGGGGGEPAAPPPPVVAPGPPGADWTTFGGDTAHRFATGDTSIAPPFGVLWSVDPGSPVNYPLIAGGRVFLSRSIDTDSTYGAIVESRDAANGRLQWSARVEGTYFAADIGYGAGKVFALNPDGIVVALDASTGAEAWRHDTEERGYSAPQVVGGTVYVNGNGKVTALDADSGERRWQRDIEDGSSGEPAIAGDRIYVNGACTIAALDRRDGRVLWRHNRGCTGGGGDTVAMWRDRVFPFTDPELGPRQAGDGQPAGGPLARAVIGDIGLAGGGRGLAAFDLPSGGRLWDAPAPEYHVGLPGHVLSFGEPEEGNARGAVTARDLRTGAEVWSGRFVQTDFGGSTRGGFRPQAAAGEGIVVVVAGSRLVALAPAAKAPLIEPFTIALRGKRDITSRDQVVLSGITGRLLGAARTRLEADVHPFDDRYRPIDEKSTSGEESEYAYITYPRRNTRFRVAGSDGRVSSTITVYAYAQVLVSFRQRGGRVLARLRVAEPKSLRARGRRVALYLGRRGSRRLVRLGTGRLSRRRQATIAFRPLANTRANRRAVVVSCLVGAHRLGLGRADALSRRCGRRTIRL